MYTNLAVTVMSAEAYESWQSRSSPIPASNRPVTAPVSKMHTRHSCSPNECKTAMPTFDSVAEQTGSAARLATNPTKLRNQHMPGERLHQCTTFQSTILMRHDAACNVQPASHPSHHAGTASQNPTHVLFYIDDQETC